MKVDTWLAITARKKYGTLSAGQIKAFKTKPSCGESEIAIKISLEIPDEVFMEPVYEAKVTLPPAKRDVPMTAVVSESVQKALSARFGFRVKVEIPEEPEQELAQ